MTIWCEFNKVVSKYDIKKLRVTEKMVYLRVSCHACAGEHEYFAMRF